MPHPNEDLIRSNNQAFTRDDEPADGFAVSEEIQWHVSGQSPLAGDYFGKTQVLEFFAKMMDFLPDLPLDDSLSLGTNLARASATENIDECKMASPAGQAVQEPLSRERQAVQKAINLIHALYDKILSLDLIARESGLPKYSFLRAFRAEVGLPPHRYQLHFRLEKAKRMIALGTPLAQVALSTGFYDQSHFHRHFMGLIGLSPRDYLQATFSARNESAQDRC